jgi:hypothetical protein
MQLWFLQSRIPDPYSLYAYLAENGLSYSNGTLENGTNLSLTLYHGRRKALIWGKNREQIRKIVLSRNGSRSRRQI